MVRSICSSFGMNPHIEHDDATFLTYVTRRITNLDHRQRFFHPGKTKWWKIVSVKTPHKGKRLKDIFQEPLVPSMDDPKVVFLHQLLDWLDTWRSKDLASGTLTKETHAALHQTTYALLEIASYCFDELGLSRTSTKAPD
ncbi:hypothetical protein HPB49_003602 [Dermacentor silvarum]|uniref:Uncharacterized protein n=1 Tax=Dermacentor silvarum TaxID=543639 RepID=A0ACB8D2Q7_DERSI|nr:hypothetical protein HPB49_003602 [Dermacentor silvarum]